MTLLNWWLSDSQVVILSDTLARRNKVPSAFVSKITTLQHLNTIIAGTGVQMLVGHWAFLVSTRSRLRGIEDLAESAPIALRQIWDQLGPPTDALGTVYHFGWSASEQRFVGYAFRSISNFEVERLPSGVFAHKPAMPDSDAPRQQSSFEDMVALVEMQRQDDDAKPLDNQVGIGGDLLCYEMGRSGDGKPMITCSHVYRFDDYEADLATMERS